jgi:uncharacterized protein (UPF0332 family)
LANHEKWNAAINRLYYSAYYAVLALCPIFDLKPTTHKGVKVVLSSHFIVTEKLPIRLGKIYSQLFALRQGGDYDDFVVFKKEEVLPYFTDVQWLIFQIEDYLKINGW